MYKKAEEMELQLREKMRGGNGTVKLLHVFKDELPKKCRLMAHITLSEGCSIGFHDHISETEIYYFLKGKGVTIDDGVERTISAGDAILTGGGAGHSVTNTGKEDMEFIAVIILD